MIVIPMAGRSSRFFKAGYAQPKYMLETPNGLVFDNAVRSFERYFESEKFLFVVSVSFQSKKWVAQRCRYLGISEFDVVEVGETRGQADTVALGVSRSKYNGCDDESVTIFNIDTFRPNFKFPEMLPEYDAYIELFLGEGDSWSFADLDNDGLVLRTAEKQRISDYCSTGLYYFNNYAIFSRAFFDSEAKGVSSWDAGELYVAPLYNHLIKNGLKVLGNVIESEDIVFCGTPTEYEALL